MKQNFKRNRTILLILNLLFAVYVSGQEKLNLKSNKFTHELNEYNLKIEIDTQKLFRIQYSDIKKSYSEAGMDFDKILAGVNRDAIFLYSLKKSKITDFRDETSISIEISKVNGEPLVIGAKDTINSAIDLNFLNKIHTNRTPHVDSVSTNKVYYDLATHTYIEKYLRLTQLMAGYNNSDQKNNMSLVEPHYGISQVFYRDGFYYIIEYKCFKSESELYFKTFESIIKSVR